MDQSWLMIIFGVAFLGIGLILLFRRSNLKKQCTAKTSGTVIGYDNRYDTDPRGRSRVTYAPIFSYEADGMIYEHTSQAIINLKTAGESLFFTRPTIRRYAMLKRMAARRG